VTVLIELLARFDEADNIKLATRLKEAGANAVYGVVGHKTHCKMMMISARVGPDPPLRPPRPELPHARGTCVHDIVLTADPYIGADVRGLFMQLTGLGGSRT
jgi:polyphosphate kinase